MGSLLEVDASPCILAPVLHLRMQEGQRLAGMHEAPKALQALQGCTGTLTEILSSDAAGALALKDKHAALTLGAMSFAITV